MANNNKIISVDELVLKWETERNLIDRRVFERCKFDLNIFEYGYEYMIIVYQDYISDFPKKNTNKMQFLYKYFIKLKEKKDLDKKAGWNIIDGDKKYIYPQVLFDIQLHKPSICFEEDTFKEKNIKVKTFYIYSELNDDCTQVGFEEYDDGGALACWGCYDVRAYIISMSWDIERLLWIGFMKENRDTCNFAKLNKDIINYIIDIICLVPKVNTRKNNKRKLDNDNNNNN
jgi:hypothetical protein